MQMAELLDSVQYVTDHEGKKKGVLLDMDVWQELVQLVKQKSIGNRIDIFEELSETFQEEKIVHHR
jgi:hypothetical protein